MLDRIKWELSEIAIRIANIPARIRDWRFHRAHPHSALFIIRRIKDGTVYALRCDMETGDVLKGGEREVYEFDHSVAPWLSAGDLHVAYSK